MRIARLRILPVIVLAGACRKASAPAASSSEGGGALAAAVRAARNSGACRRVVAQEWANGLPVPLSAPGRYALFFYPMAGAPPKEPVMATPAATAVVDAASGSVVECRARPDVPRDLAAPYWPDGVEQLDEDAFDARAAKLDALTEAAGAAYAARRAPTPADADAAKNYFALFDATAELPLRADYYRLNPSFWEWVRAAGGRSLAKP